jgi:hypothetical protein
LSIAVIREMQIKTPSLLEWLESKSQITGVAKDVEKSESHILYGNAQ